MNVPFSRKLQAVLAAVSMIGTIPIAVAADPATYVHQAGKFESCGPEIPGCEHILLQGDPTSGPSQHLYRMKKGFDFVKHWHVSTENLVMVKGTIVLNTEGGKEQTLKAGDFVRIPASLVHWGKCPDDCVFYLGLDGPDSFNVVDK